MIRKLIAAICLATSLGGMALHGQDASRTLITNALEETDIFSDRRFVLDATISAAHGKDRSEGKYRLIWLGPEQWREEIGVGQEKVTRIGSKSVVYQRASSEVAEEMLLVFAKLFRFRAELEFPLERRSRLKKEKVKQFQRVTFDSDRGATLRRLSFDQGHLAYVLNYGIQQGTDDSWWSEMPDFQKLEDYRLILGKKFPFQISSEYRGATFAATVQSITAVEREAVEPALFAVDGSFRESNSCFSPTRQEKAKAEPLRLPFQRFRGSTFPGPTVYVPSTDVTGVQPRSQLMSAMVFTTISEQGTVASTRLLTPDSAFDAAVLDAIRQSKYEPPRCNGRAASYTTIIRVKFLSYPLAP